MTHSSGSISTSSTDTARDSGARGTSSTSSERQPLQTMSGLRTLKRAWSGSKVDLGIHPQAQQQENKRAKQEEGDDDDDVDAKGGYAAAAHLLPSSTPEQPIPWSRSPSPAAVVSQKLGAPSSSRREKQEQAGQAAPPRPRQLPRIFSKAANEAKEEARRRRNATIFKTGVAKDETDAFGAKKTKVSKVFLSKEQRHVYELAVQQGVSVFFTGSAGTGKSVLLREIISGLRAKYVKRADAVAVTASTGIAACNIGGVTLHSHSGIGLGSENAQNLCSKIRRNRKAHGRWMRTQVLIIDEISMIEGDLFDKLEEIARILRKSQKPFGGIQVIVAGDFFQLPPVAKDGKSVKFAFEANTWNTVLREQVNLTQVFRQRDQTFVDMLNEMRFGQLSSASIERFRQLQRPPTYAPGITPTELFPIRAEVDRANASRLNALKAPLRRFEARDGGPPDTRERLLAQFMPPPTVMLKVGAQVMLIKNIDETLVNGSIGTVVAFLEEREFRAASLKSDMTQVDERGALMLSKEAQEELEGRRRASANMAEAIEAKAAAVEHGGGGGEAAKSASGVATAAAATTSSMRSGSNLEAEAKRARSRSTSPVKTMPSWPIVRFVVPGGYRTEVITPETWKNEMPNGEIQASREQVPLILAWAMSIHKAQGQTLPCCKINLSRVFEKGQAYVALSRATTLEGLEIHGFDPTKVMAHPKVIEWSRSLATKA